MLIHGVETHWLSFGEGRPLLILHGWGSSSERWQPLAERLADVGYHVVVPDLPGFGQSAEPPEDWTLDAYVAWARALIAELGWTRFDLLAHSFGGRVSIRWLSQGSEAIDRVWLCAAAGVRPTGLKIGLKRTVLGSLAKLGKPLMRVFGSGPLGRKLLYKLAREHDYEQASPRMQAIMRQAIETDQRDELPHIARPVTLLWGAEDRLTPLSQARTMEQLLPQADLIVHPSAGHAVYRTELDWMVARLGAAPDAELPTRES